MTRRTFGLGVALTCLGFTHRKEQQMTTTPPEPDPLEEPKPDKPPKKDETDRPYHETNRLAGKR